MHKLTGICLISGFSIVGMIACNNGDYQTSKDSSDSTGVTAGSGAKTADSTATPGSTATNNANAAMDTAGAAAAKTAKTIHRKGKASITMPMSNKEEKMMMDKEGVYNNAEVMPEFPGGQDALANYVNNHVEYPQQAIDRNTTGTVKVSFVVDEKGKVTKAQLMNDKGQKIGDGLDEEALRVVNTMPAWKPGKVKGKIVKTRLELPLNFQFES